MLKSDQILNLNKSQFILYLFNEKKENHFTLIKSKIEETELKKLYSLKTPPEYPQAFDKTFNVKDIKGDMNKEELMFFVVDKDGKTQASLPLKVVDVSKKAVGLSDPTQSDQLRSYIPKVQMLVRGAYKDTKKTVIIVESPYWVLNNIKNKGIKV